MQFSDPNTILEINESHTDNFILVIPKLPTASLIGAEFANLTRPLMPTPTFSQPGSACGDGPEFDPSNPNLNSVGTSGTSGVDGNSICNPTQKQREQRIARDANLDLVNYRLYLSDVDLPAINIDTVTLGTQFASINRASKINFGELSTNMLISENFLNYNIILYWLYALHNPEEYNKMSGRGMINEFFVELYLIIVNNHREKVAEYKFIDAFPKSLSSIPFSYKTADKITSSVTWAHSGYVPSNNYVLKYI